MVYVEFIGANLTDAQLWWTDLFGADFTDATLLRTELTEARLDYTRFPRANLTDAYLSESSLVETDFEGATLTGCNVYGIAAWDVILSGATQSNLIITPPSAEDYQPTITVDNLEVAQFVYLLLENERLRDVIETMTSKVVLILGNFAPERKEVLEAIKERLRQGDYLPIMFDFEGSESRNLVETVTTVARLSRFVIADITQPRSVPDELRAIVPDLPSVPVQPVIESSEEPYATFRDLVVRDSVLKLHRYRDLQDLLATFDEAIITTAEKKLRELEIARLRALEKL